MVIIQGSESDAPYVNKIVTALSGYPFPVERRIASAHRTPGHLQRVIDNYQDFGDSVVYVTVAGLSDGLSGTTAGRVSGRVVACPPDYGKYGKTKIFSSARTPKGVDVQFARTPEEAAQLVAATFEKFDFSCVGELRQQALRKQEEVILADARLQGVEEPALPYTVFRRGKTRDVYDLGDGTLRVRATDRVSAFDVVLHERIPGKGKSLTDLSQHWFKLTDELVPNHFIARTDDTSIRVKKARRVNIEWVARGYIYGSLWREYQKGTRFMYGIELPDGLELASELPQPILTPTTKSDVGHDKPITKDKAIERGLVKDVTEWNTLAGNTFALYRFYRTYAAQRGLIVPDFKVEFGIVDGHYIQIDEPPNHDSARLWDERFYQRGKEQEGHALDKEFLRQYLFKTGYSGDGEPPHLPPQVVEQVSLRCCGASEVLQVGEDASHFDSITKNPILRPFMAE